MVSTQAVSKTPHGSNVAGSKGIVAMNTNTNTNISQPSKNNVQAVIVARALNIFGIFHLLYIIQPPQIRRARATASHLAVTSALFITTSQFP